MYVVRRPFKNFGETLTAGSVIKDPAGIKRFKSKLTDGKIVEVTEQNFEQYRNYFKTKFGVELGVELVVNEDKGNNENTDDNSLSGADTNESNDNSTDANENENSDSTNVTQPAVVTAKAIAN